MKDEFLVYLTKAEESLSGAELEFAAGYYNNCANRCYTPAFRQPCTPWRDSRSCRRVARPRGGTTHSSPVFARELVTRRKALPAAVSSVISRAYELPSPTGGRLSKLRGRRSIRHAAA